MGIANLPGVGHNPAAGLTAPSSWGDDVNAAFVDIDTDLGASINDTGWTAYTPQVDQGGTLNIAKTIVYSKYRKIGKTVLFEYRLNITAGGTAGADILVSVPFNFSAAGAAQVTCGTGQFYDVSAAILYCGDSFSTSATRFKSCRDASAGAGGMGQYPNVALAAGDIIFGAIFYEAA